MFIVPLVSEALPEQIVLHSTAHHIFINGNEKEDENLLQIRYRIPWKTHPQNRRVILCCSHFLNLQFKMLRFTRKHFSHLRSYIFLLLNPFPILRYPYKMKFNFVADYLRVFEFLYSHFDHFFCFYTRRTPFPYKGLGSQAPNVKDCITMCARRRVILESQSIRMGIISAIAEIFSELLLCFFEGIYNHQNDQHCEFHRQLLRNEYLPA